MPEPRIAVPIYFTELEVTNVRCFGKKQRLDLTAAGGGPAPWTLILGENGVGKTTLLECLSWMRPVQEVPLRAQFPQELADLPDDEILSKVGELLQLADLSDDRQHIRYLRQRIRRWWDLR